SQATVAGYKAVVVVADALPKMFPMMTTAAGTIAPARVFVIGAGVAGLQAIATAPRLGAVVEAYDVRPAVKEQVESLGAKLDDPVPRQPDVREERVELPAAPVPRWRARDRSRRRDHARDARDAGGRGRQRARAGSARARRGGERVSADQGRDRAVRVRPRDVP